MNILLTGATGFIGQHIQQALNQAGHQVIPVSRQHGIDFNQQTTVEDWLPRLQGIEAVINAVGIITETRKQTFDILHYRAPCALFRACQQMAIPRVVQISALGADQCAYTPYQRSKKAADDVLRTLPLAWFILRPSLVYGPGGKSMALFQRIAGLPVIPLLGKAPQYIQPVHISDLVTAVQRCLQKSPAQQTIDVVGAKALSFAAWLQKIRQANAKKAAPSFVIPWPLVMAGAQIGRHVMPLAHPDNLRMLQQGNTADVQPFADFLGAMPLSVEEGLEYR